MEDKSIQGPSVKRKHVTLTIPQKLEIIRRLESGESRTSIMEEFNIGSSTIYDIKKRKDQLCSFVASSETMRGLMKRQTLKQPKLAQLDKVVYRWFTDMRSQGITVTGPMIIDKAKAFYAEMEITEKCIFSDGWLRNFKERHGIRKMSSTGELCTEDAEATEGYSEFFSTLLKEQKLLPTQIYNGEGFVEEWMVVDKDTPVVQYNEDDFPNVKILQVASEEEEEKEVITEPKRKYTWNQASEFITKFVEFAETSSHYTPAEVMNLRIVLDNFYQKKASFMKQLHHKGVYKKRSKRTSSQKSTPTTSIIVKTIDPHTPERSISPVSIEYKVVELDGSDDAVEEIKLEDTSD
ncbi:39S ribosomal protein L23, mitochondrial isoform X1 [Hyla sarda]|uniref:39S ribosomal protein L23, mitochondrial isoform X1 n=1 Tax=Hyla sarda TaxID=327740 RepID=UPI0024C3680A|nr:39S ribosomal protein L23, mitochondrial isoform X1 [Hyla sarda]XP_056382836.1 39S ribosomal protein L23, mitochondrial isoform X1 [Hyla sarda]